MKQRHVTFESQHKVVQGDLILSERLGVVLVHFIDDGSPHERDSALPEKKKRRTERSAVVVDGALCAYIQVAGRPQVAREECWGSHFGYSHGVLLGLLRSS